MFFKKYKKKREIANMINKEMEVSLNEANEAYDTLLDEYKKLSNKYFRLDTKYEKLEHDFESLKVDKDYNGATIALLNHKNEELFIENNFLKEKNNDILDYLKTKVDETEIIIGSMTTVVNTFEHIYDKDNLDHVTFLDMLRTTTDKVKSLYEKNTLDK